MTLTAVLKDKQQSVTQFLVLENVLGSEIYMRMCVVYDACVHNVIPRVRIYIFIILEYELIARNMQKYVRILSEIFVEICSNLF